VGTFPFVVEFNDQSSDKWGDINTYFWDFGDGSRAWGDRTFHYYTGNDGAYTVSLTVTGPGGSDTETKISYIHEPGSVLHPVIDKITRRNVYPGDRIRIIGYNFGDSQGDSILHVGGLDFSSSNPRIKLWTDTKIRIRLPVNVWDCDWFNGGAYQSRRVWVTTGDDGGEESNKKRVKVLKPDALVCE
jgi:PKD repeat protein